MKIFDNVLDKHFLDYINYTISKMKWELHASTYSQKTPMFFDSRTIDEKENVQRDEYLFLFRIICGVVALEPEILGMNVNLKRGYVNLCPYGIGGDWHKDTGTPNAITMLFYPSDWKEEYGGATEFQETGEKVEYKKNRLLMFDGTKLHRSAVHQNPKNRYSISFKTEIKMNSDIIKNIKVRAL